MKEIQRLMPKKADYRQRAHSNPLVDHDLTVPIKPSMFKWDMSNPPDYIDIGCGFGGLTVDLARDFPDKFIVGMELRVQVSQYVILRIKGLREIHKDTSQYINCQCIRMNCMKFMPNFFKKKSIEKIFILFADPHFKKQKHKHRIITVSLLAEYAYITKVGGILYTATDVLELHTWNCRHLDACALFEKLTEEEENSDPMKHYILNSTEEGKKVSRNDGPKYFAFYRRIEDPVNK
eukprot:NODE_69_length_23719_cov_0.556689.p11 type:complete len:235 gc:universal NODE_69_length_23719_cov_0.556689:9344-10048(+)